MSNPTSNFGWQMPTATDLVTDLPADFEVFGQAVDTDLADLNGGTTGQILSKTSNTDLDFTWINNDQGDITGVTAGTGISGGGTSGNVTVTNSMATAIDAKGDLVAGTGADAFSRLAVGANDTVLTADSAQATGLKWATPSTGGMTLISTTTLTGASVSLTSIPQTYNNLQLVFENFRVTTDETIFQLRFNSDTNSNYGWVKMRSTASSTSNNNNIAQINISDDNEAQSNVAANSSLVMDIFNYTAAVDHNYNISFNYERATLDDTAYVFLGGVHRPATAAAISSIQIFANAGNIAGTAYLYGVK